MICCSIKVLQHCHPMQDVRSTKRHDTHVRTRTHTHTHINRKSWTIALQRYSKQQFGTMFFQRMFEVARDVHSIFITAIEEISVKFVDVSERHVLCTSCRAPKVFLRPCVTAPPCRGVHALRVHINNVMGDKI
jgi:hypothetical protein